MNNFNKTNNIEIQITRIHLYIHITLYTACILCVPI